MLGNMSDAILTFQVQLSGVMETVLKSAMFEITRLVEHSFLEEVARSKQEVEALRQRLEWSESRCREREGSGRSRCADCGRVGVSSEGTEDRPSGTQSEAEGAPPLPLSKSCSELEWSPAVRQDTAPSSGSLLPEQQNSRHRAGETCGLYESELGQERVARSLSLAGPQHCSRRHNDLDSERVTWTIFKLGGSDNEADGLDPSSAAVPEPASPSAQRDPQPGPAEEGAGNSVSPLRYLNVKSEGGVADWLLIKEEAEIQPVCSEDIRWDVAHTEPWDRGDLQVENTAHLPPLQGAVTSLQSSSEKVESLTLQFCQQQKQLRQSQSLKAAQNTAERHVDPTDASGSTSHHKAFTEKRTKVDMREITAEASLDPVDRNRGASWDNKLLNVSNKIQRGFTGDKPFSCVQCGKSFTQLKNLQAHLKHHTGEKPHRCTQCGKSFLYQSRLKVHLLSHTGERPFSCTYCEKSFLSFYDLKVHQRNHTGEKPYSCTQCGKGFTRLSILKEHRIIHSKEKSFCCTLCGKRFTRPSNLKAHLRRHIVAKQHGCTLCGKSFLYLCRLKKHQRKFHWTEAS